MHFISNCSFMLFLFCLMIDRLKIYNRKAEITLASMFMVLASFLAFFPKEICMNFIMFLFIAIGNGLPLLIIITNKNKIALLTYIGLIFSICYIVAVALIMGGR